VVLVRLLNLVLVLRHVLIEVILVLYLFCLLLLSQLLDVRKHNLHVKILTTTFLLIELFRDQGCIPLSGVGAIVP